MDAAGSEELLKSSTLRAPVKSRGVPMPATWGEEDAVSCGLDMLNCWLLMGDCEVSSSGSIEAWIGGVDASWLAISWDSWRASEAMPSSSVRPCT